MLRRKLVETPNRVSFHGLEYVRRGIETLQLPTDYGLSDAQMQFAPTAPLRVPRPWHRGWGTHQEQAEEQPEEKQHEPHVQEETNFNPETQEQEEQRQQDFYDMIADDPILHVSSS